MNLQEELILPCGAKLKNRIAKSAMSENMSPKHHGPYQIHYPCLQTLGEWRFWS